MTLSEAVARAAPELADQPVLAAVLQEALPPSFVSAEPAALRAALAAAWRHTQAAWLAGAPCLAAVEAAVCDAVGRGVDILAPLALRSHFPPEPHAAPAPPPWRSVQRDGFDLALEESALAAALHSPTSVPPHNTHTERLCSAWRGVSLRCEVGPLDFGVQLCPEPQPRAPFSQLLEDEGGARPQAAPAARALHRACCVRNDGPDAVALLSLRLLPAAAQLCILDDACLGCSAGSGGDVVVLPPGARYQVVLRLSVTGPPLGCWWALLLATVAAWPPPPPQAGASCVAAASVLGMRVGATLLGASAERALRCVALSVDAPAYVPAALRARFDAPPLFAAAVAVPPGVGLAAAIAAGRHWNGAQPLPPPPAACAAVLSRLRRLLALELDAQAAALRRYDRHNVSLQPADGRLWLLPVPGLAEHRPSLLPGDRVRLRAAVALPPPAAAAAGAVAGDVEAVAYVVSADPRAGTVALALPDVLAWMGVAQPLSARFVADTSLHERQLGALSAVAAAAAAGGGGGSGGWGRLPQLLPCTPGLDPPPFHLPPGGGLAHGVAAAAAAAAAGGCAAAGAAVPGLELFNGDLNAEQRLAVALLLDGHAAGAPLALWGPPGTGKTATLVECALQLLRRLRRGGGRGGGCRGRLLLVASAPFAADLLASRLVAAAAAAAAAAGPPSPKAAGRGQGAGGGCGRLTPAMLCRVDDPRRPRAAVKADVLPYWRAYDCKAQVVVCSCASAALLRGPGLGVKPFDAILLDEAAQATVPESLICLAPPLADARTSVVLCGDPRQLGPVLQSRAAAAAGLRSSLLELFVDAASAAAAVDAAAARGGGGGGGDGRVRVVLLRRNYRSHPELLRLPGDMLYGGALLAAAPPALTSLPDRWVAGPRGAGRIHFHGVLGEQRRDDADSPSWYNALEADAVVNAVAELLSAGLGMDDLGVIATYRRQVTAIRLLLRARGLGAVRVGSVDDYQGQEERVIVVSCVASRPPEAGAAAAAAGGDSDDSILGSVRRFCVAVSRARALNFVIGHPVALAGWPHWRALLTHAIGRGAVSGAAADDGWAGNGGACDGAGVRAAVARLAQGTLLGGGCAPADEGGWADSQERGWRVAL